MTQTFPRQIGRSLLALLAGFVLVLLLTFLSDAALHAAGVFPAPGQAPRNGSLVLATVYRTLYGILGSYVTARLAPYAPLAHALVGGAIGLVLSTLGAVAAVSHPEKFGAAWYPIALVILALPTAWVGGKIRTAQLDGAAA